MLANFGVGQLIIGISKLNSIDIVKDLRVDGEGSRGTQLFHQERATRVVSCSQSDHVALLDSVELASGDQGVVKHSWQ